VRALFAYVAKIEDELSFPKGAIILVKSTESADDGWWEGEYNGKTGVFPANYVEILKSGSGADPSLPPPPRPSSSVIPPNVVPQFTKKAPGELGEPLLEKEAHTSQTSNQRFCGGYLPECSIL